MNKLILIVSLFCLMGFENVFAMIDAPKVKANPESIVENKEEVKAEVLDLLDENIENIKTVLIKGIDAVILQMQKIEETLAVYPQTEAILQTEKLVEQTISYLEGQKVKINQAQSIEDLRNIQKETVQYLKDHKDEIKNAVKKACDEAYNTTVSYMNSYLDLVEAQVKIYKVSGLMSKDDADAVLSEVSKAREKITLSEESYDKAVANQDNVAMKQALKYLAEAGELIYQIQTEISNVNV